MRKDAIIEGPYRYRLQRDWRAAFEKSRTMCFVMLNPSTADAEFDDPTIRKCIGFSKREGCTRLDVVNLFAYRTTNPRELDSVELDEAIGPKNDEHIADALASSDVVVVAWGAHALEDRAATVLEMIRKMELEALCLKTTKSGAPWHPLYVANAEPLKLYGKREAA